MRGPLKHLYPLGRPLLFACDAETAHTLTVKALCRLPRAAAWAQGSVAHSPVQLLGMRFPNPIGVAAGLDKNGECVDGLHRLGFGFVEVGTVTPRPQPGNPQPRIFRLRDQQAIINRLGFNSKGIDYVRAKLQRRRGRGLLGVNIGKNADTENADAAADYLAGLDAFAEIADYITVNISSPNTRGLRDLQAAAPLRELIDQLVNRREQLSKLGTGRTPLLVKLAPDLEPAQMDAAAQALNGSGLDGVICGNTTISRPGLEGVSAAREQGGLSGVPLRALAQRTFSELRSRLDSAMPMIGVGGIHDSISAGERFAAGADLLQIYTGLVYDGPGLLHELVQAHLDLTGNARN